MMYNTFNMGLGMILAVDPEDVEKTMDAIRAAGDAPYVVGKIEEGEKGSDLMLRVVVMVSGGGTNLQAILDAVDAGRITNTEIVGVISNNKNAYALTRAAEHGIKQECISPKDYESRAEFNEALIGGVDSYQRIWSYWQATWW